MQRISLGRDAGAKLALDLVELHAALDAFDEAFRLFRLHFEDPLVEHLLPIEWLPVSEN